LYLPAHLLFLALTLGQQRVDLLAQLLKALEALVDAGEADVRDLVDLAQLVHGRLADDPRRDLGRATRAQGSLDLFGRLLRRVGRDRPPGERLGQARRKLVAIELLAPTVALEHGQAGRLYALVGREARRAQVALASAPDRGVVDVARIDDARVTFPAVRAAHGRQSLTMSHYRLWRANSVPLDSASLAADSHFTTDGTGPRRDASLTIPR